MNYPLFISCPKGLEYLLEEEVKALGLHNIRVSPQGVYGDATLAVLYTLCLWSRIANRVQLILFSGYASNEQSIKNLCLQFHWQTVFTPDRTLAIVFHGASDLIRNTMFGAQVVKDGIVDHFRNITGTRPVIDKHKPDILIHAHLKNDTLTVSLDLVGYSLHQRGYRQEAGEAPLKENLAAAILLRAKWPELALKGYAFHDPFCGAGTLVIEAAMMAAHVAPGLLRQDQALPHWVQHQPSLWEKMRASALQQVKPIPMTLLGTDADERAIAMAIANAERAGVLPLVTFKSCAVEDCQSFAPQGLVLCNPPYGERLGEVTQLVPLYQQLGSTLHHHYHGWQAGVLTSEVILAKALGLRAHKQYTLYNGAIACKLYCMDIAADNKLKGSQETLLSPAAQMLFNRLEKNYKHLKKWAKNNAITCYRLYDADLPEYAYAIDIYKDYAVLQEYAAPSSIPVHKAKQRSLDVLQVLPKILEMSADKLVIKERKQQRGNSQYEKQNHSGKTMVVNEGSAKFLVNLYDYLDTGLFLDHRPLRLQFGQLKDKPRFLNCFCYTGTASVHAALAAATTTNVDLSTTYLQWARDNFILNGLDLNKHEFIQDDCKTWMRTTRERFDVIFLDPPSFSNSKRMIDTLDIQRDHVALINAAMRLLNPSGLVYFSTNLRGFKLDALLEQKFAIQDISKQTIDLDFKDSPKIHQCFKISMLGFA